MKVLYITQGHSSHDTKFLTAIAEHGYDVEALRLSKPRNSPLLPFEIICTSWKGINEIEDWEAYLKLEKELSTIINIIKPDIIHAGPIQYGAFLAALTSSSIPLVSVSWGFDMLINASRNKFMRWITLFTLERSKVLIADNKAIKQKAIDMGFPNEQIVTFPWGVDLQHFTPIPSSPSKIRQKLGWGNKFVLITLRQWEGLYNVDLVIKAFSQAIKVVPSMRMILLNTGSQKKGILDLIKVLRLEEAIFLGGQISQEYLPEYYRASDIYVSAASTDGSSVSLMEALACGCPAIVPNIPGNKQWIDEGVHGWFFEVESGIEQLSNAIIHAYQVWDSNTYFIQMQNATRQKAELEANWLHNRQKLDIAYKLSLK